MSQETKLTWGQAPAAFHALKAADTLQAFRAALKRVDITSYDPAGDHPLHWAIRADSDRLQRLWLMLLAGASARECGAQDAPLHVFATTKRRDENEQFSLAQMLVQAGADLEGLQHDGLTPLACAIRQRGVFEARALLRLGADPNATSPCWIAASDQQVSAPLLFGASEDVRIFKDMLDHGADPTLCSHQGQSLADYLDAEIHHLQDELNDMGISQNLRRRLKRSASALTKSRDLLQTRLGGD
ncbi:hypothetical protein GG681_03390 [Epibacterium sp. SM1969]|uniref:Ankyrin repeats (3 copies) n=1 Tax=Tritonibacter aquimaris TaxID=2663379 RepID=A0A844AUJ2_9RHOB|nr:hypothetical protein [Tritonibacter aquimaris]MQY41671.1 hypothetical protein [Tritonibacter aquimaris]